MSGYHRNGGNKRGKPRRKGVDVFASGKHSDPRMNLTLADIKRMHPEMCAVPKSVTLIDDSNKWNVANSPTAMKER